MASQGFQQGTERDYAIRPVSYTPTDTSRLGWQYRSMLTLPTLKPPMGPPLNYYGIKHLKVPPLDPDKIWQPAGMYPVYKWEGPLQPAPGIDRKLNVNL